MNPVEFRKAADDMASKKIYDIIETAMRGAIAQGKYEVVDDTGTIAFTVAFGYVPTKATLSLATKWAEMYDWEVEHREGTYFIRFVGFYKSP